MLNNRGGFNYDSDGEKIGATGSEIMTHKNRAVLRTGTVEWLSSRLTALRGGDILRVDFVDGSNYLGKRVGGGSVRGRRGAGRCNNRRRLSLGVG